VRPPFGVRTRALAAALRRREHAAPNRRATLDARTRKALARSIAIVYTDTDDFTRRVDRHGMLHFLMVFARGVRTLRKVAARHSGRLVKVEADSLLLAFPDAERACRASLAMREALERLNRGRPASERLAFSFGVGYGEVLDLGRDLLGLEVNLASKLGEDRARRGEILLTPDAASTLPPEWRTKLVSSGNVRFTSRPMRVFRLAHPHRG